MTSRPAFRRLLSIAGAGVVFALILGVLFVKRGVAPSVDAQGAAKAPRTWPLWGGTVQRNLVNTFETNIARDWDSRAAKMRNVSWSVDLGSKAYGGPTFGDGKIFIGTNNNRPRNKAVRGDKGIVMCFDQNGAFLWQMIHDKLLAGRVMDWPEEGICSAPVIEGDRIWYVSNRCEVVCATTEGMVNGNNAGPFKGETYKSKIDGDVVWKLDMIGQLGVFPHNLATCSPLIVGDKLFVITSNGVDQGHINIPAPNAPSFICVDKKTGKVLWTSKLPGRNIMHGQWSNPVYAGVNAGNKRAQIIFPGGDGFIYSLNPDTGDLLWKFDCNPKGSVYRLGGRGTRNDFVCTPIIWENKLYIGVGQDPEHKKGVGHMWCIDITREPQNKDKDVSPWSDPKDEAPSKFDPKDPRNKNSALVWHYGGGAPKGGDPRGYWFGRTLSTCAVHEGLCYGADFDGHVYCFDARTGKLHWKHEMEDADTWSSPYWVDGHVYIGNENGEMYIFKHGAKKQHVKTVEMRGKIRATPVALNGVLYVMTENPCKLFAIK